MAGSSNCRPFLLAGDNMKLLIEKLRRPLEAGMIFMLFAMIALTFADVLGRKLFEKPVFGAHDITEHLMALIIFSGLPLLTAQRGHLCVDLFDRFLNKPGMLWWHHIIAIAVACTLFLISYQYGLAAIEAVEIREISLELSIPRGYIYWFISVSAALSGLLALLGKHQPHHPHNAQEMIDGGAA